MWYCLYIYIVLKIINSIQLKVWFEEGRNVNNIPLWICVCVSVCEMRTRRAFSSGRIFLIQIALSAVCVVQCKEVCDIHATIIRRIENEGFHR